jgi:hypothetical protein
MVSYAASASWELLQSTNLIDQDLATLQTNWERQKFISGMEKALETERARTENTIKRIRTSPEDFYSSMGILSSGRVGGSGDWQDGLKDLLNDAESAGAKFMWRTSWTYSDELQALRDYQIILETIRTVRTNQFFNPAYSNMVNKCEAMETTNSTEDWLDQLDTAGLRHLFFGDSTSSASAIHRTMTAETCKRIVVTAIALKRFQLKHGNYPERLSDLTPEFLVSVPLDPVDGQPLRYRRNADGTDLLYSIGEDGVDGGGDTTALNASNWNWQRARDWVWPQPASPAEVQHYYEHPPK